MRGLSAILLLVAATAHAVNGPTSETYDNEEFGFSMRRPSAEWVWKLPDKNPEQLGSKVASINGNAGFELMAKLVRDPKTYDETASNVTVDHFGKKSDDGDAFDYARIFAASMKPNDESFKLLSPGKQILLGGRNGAIIEIESTLKKKDADGSPSQYVAHVDAIFVAVDNNWVRFILSARQSDWKTVAPEIQKIIESIRFQLPPEKTEVDKL